ncbi:MAG: NAD(P)/FAD-dependent oxidoreductase [Halarcobacter sp.]
MNPTKKIMVLGAGIAGVTTAIGLKKLGFDVTIIYKNRPFRAYEGLSQKTKDGFSLLDCKNCFSQLNTQSVRNSNWAGMNSQVNYEYVVCRDDFDKALLQDAKEHNISLIRGNILGKIDFQDKVSVKYKSENIENTFVADFVVDTRGRFTPYKSEYKHGPKSFSILQELELDSMSQSKTSIDTVENGWIWQAYVGENRGYIQFTCDEELAKKIESFEDVKPFLENQGIDLWSLKNHKLKGSLVKRDSYCKVHKTIVTDKMILVGDSASSIDPLSGNGVFQALSMSSIAPYVINTILNREKNKEIAIDFYKKRVNYIFEKFSKVGKDFYSLEKRFKTDFWIKRQTWPLNTIQDESIKIANYAIVKDGFIEPKEVVITKDNPLGIYFLGNIEIVELVKYCLNNSVEKALNFFDDFCEKKSLSLDSRIFLKKWLLNQSII